MKRCRLIYRSTAVAGRINVSVVRDITEKAQESNKKDGIVGMLLMSGNQFLQVLEGPVRYVNQLYQKIAQDERHTNVELISYEQINTPYFYDWSMRLVNLGDLEGNQRKQVERKYPHQNGTLVLPDNPILLYSLLHDARDLFGSA